MVISRSHYKLKDGTRVSRRYYSCGAFKSKGSSVCHANSVRADYAEEYVLNCLKKVLRHPKMLEDIVVAVNRKRTRGVGDLAKELIIIENNLEQLTNKKRKILDVYELDSIDRETLSVRLEELSEETRQLYDRKSEIECEMGNGGTQEVSLEVVQELLGKLDRAIEKALPEQKKSMIHLAVGEITLTEDRKIGKVVLNFDDQLQKQLLQEDPSAHGRDGGSLSCSGVGKMKLRGLRIAI